MLDGMEATIATILPAPEDTAPAEAIDPDSDSPAMLVSEPAGQAIPAALNRLEVARNVIERHCGWDIGAENVGKLLAARRNAPSILQPYSRLVVKSNRPPHGEGLIPEIGDATPIPGNRAVPTWQSKAQIDEIFSPFDQATAEHFARHPRCYSFSVHIFTPIFAGQSCPWHAGFVMRPMDFVQVAGSEALLALDKPYRIDDASDRFTPVHAEPRNIPHCMIEIRNDPVTADDGTGKWAALSAAAIPEQRESTSCP
ncbi:MAG: N-formylglutamate amidohydrolase [Rhodospirillales bacterium]|nr:N-formylglutamate amidohydrolase [Rhodospirillales bacterium]